MAHKQALQKSLEETKVQYKNLGNSGLRISVPILGAMSFGDPNWNSWVIDESKALPLLKAAYDRGLNTWDTADIYSNGKSEEIIGNFMKQYDIPRHKLVIMTKCFAHIGEEYSYQNEPEMQRSKDYVNHGGLSRQAIFRAIDASLKRLQTDYVDVYQIHRFDPTVPIEETMTALHDLVRAGKVRYIGASSMRGTEFARMQHVAELKGLTKFVSMQNHYSLLYREEELEMNNFCNATGVALVPWAPLCRGHLARPLDTSTERSTKEGPGKTGYGELGFTEVDKKIIGRVQELAEKKGWTMSQVSLAWINKRCASPIIGFSSVDRLEDALGAKDKVLTDEEEKYLEELKYQALQAVALACSATRYDGRVIATSSHEDGDKDIDDLAGYSTSLLPIFEEINDLNQARETPNTGFICNAEPGPPHFDCTSLLEHRSHLLFDRITALLAERSRSGLQKSGKYPSAVSQDFYHLDEAYHHMAILQVFRRGSLSVPFAVIDNSRQTILKCLEAIEYRANPCPGVAALPPLFVAGSLCSDAVDRMRVRKLLKTMWMRNSMGNVRQCRVVLEQWWKERDEGRSAESFGSDARAGGEYDEVTTLWTVDVLPY
ncbi:Versiconal hemiacetal acetate [Cyphellophora attinorum]|uniref:Versiconal hemiacetal acetate n=1 Tax=Cyphellophora attinorum TaxID=1664694 RepID=A0A0N1HM30_9EURO|nr:Versiconal hemiacetal acetate [Phialophora attinorum]KPI35732.1 Versiconal hemiacetal acetate [Phialophora attinorum]